MSVYTSEKVIREAQAAEAACAEQFARIDAAALENSRRVLDAFSECRVSDSHFAGTTGYGYDDAGREVIDRVFAKLFGTDAALVRHTFVNGTHAIATALFGLLHRGDVLLSVTGAPYDTLREAVAGDHPGSLVSAGVEYRQVDLLPDGSPDLDAIKANIGGASAVFIQRSKGYTSRKSLSIADIKALCGFVKGLSPDVTVIVDNCYGEFCETLEPTAVGADVAAGSLIKNPGGGIARGGGYIAGGAKQIELCADRLTAPGIGLECGATFGFNREILQGLFVAPHVVAQAVKTAVFAAALAQRLGYDAFPAFDVPRTDIVQELRFGAEDKLLAFCAGIQAASPIDSFVTPVGWAMPGYDCDVVMAAGAFTQGASIELSCDGPLRPPYTAYLQGGLTYESGKLGIISAFSRMEE
ncbi:MAG: methionine gamma-lyase family protein [Clostridia bacterium]|nr:methionine gamma-lyase family protein [Clostridia bacterium]